MNIEISQVFTQIVSFLIMLWVLRRTAWKPLLQILDERKAKIQGEFDQIDAEKIRLGKLEEEYQNQLKTIDNQSRIKINEAIEKGNKISQQIVEDAHKKAKGILVKAEEDLKFEIAKAKVQLKGEIVDMALLATQKVIKQDLDQSKQKKLISEFVEQTEFN